MYASAPSTIQTDQDFGYVCGHRPCLIITHIVERGSLYHGASFILHNDATVPADSQQRVHVVQSSLPNVAGAV